MLSQRPIVLPLAPRPAFLDRQYTAGDVAVFKQDLDRAIARAKADTEMLAAETRVAAAMADQRKAQREAQCRAASKEKKARAGDRKGTGKETYQTRTIASRAKEQRAEQRPRSSAASSKPRTQQRAVRSQSQTSSAVASRQASTAASDYSSAVLPLNSTPEEVGTIHPHSSSANDNTAGGSSSPDAAAMLLSKLATPQRQLTPTQQQSVAAVEYSPASAGSYAGYVSSPPLYMTHGRVTPQRKSPGQGPHSPGQDITKVLSVSPGGSPPLPSRSSSWKLSPDMARSAQRPSLLDRTPGRLSGTSPASKPRSPAFVFDAKAAVASPPKPQATGPHQQHQHHQVLHQQQQQSQDHQVPQQHQLQQPPSVGAAEQRGIVHHYASPALLIEAQQRHASANAAAAATAAAVAAANQNQNHAPLPPQPVHAAIGPSLDASLREAHDSLASTPPKRSPQGPGASGVHEHESEVSPRARAAPPMLLEARHSLGVSEASPDQSRRSTGLSSLRSAALLGLSESLQDRTYVLGAESEGRRRLSSGTDSLRVALGTPGTPRAHLSDHSDRDAASTTAGCSSSLGDRSSKGDHNSSSTTAKDTSSRSPGSTPPATVSLTDLMRTAGPQLTTTNSGRGIALVGGNGQPIPLPKAMLGALHQQQQQQQQQRRRESSVYVDPAAFALEAQRRIAADEAEAAAENADTGAGDGSRHRASLTAPSAGAGSTHSDDLGSDEAVPYTGADELAQRATIRLQRRVRTQEEALAPQAQLPQWAERAAEAAAAFQALPAEAQRFLDDATIEASVAHDELPPGMTITPVPARVHDLVTMLRTLVAWTAKEMAAVSRVVSQTVSQVHSPADHSLPLSGPASTRSPSHDDDDAEPVRGVWEALPSPTRAHLRTATTLGMCFPPPTEPPPLFDRALLIAAVSQLAAFPTAVSPDAAETSDAFEGISDDATDTMRYDDEHVLRVAALYSSEGVGILREWAMALGRFLLQASRDTNGGVVSAGGRSPPALMIGASLKRDSTVSATASTQAPGSFMMPGGTVKSADTTASNVTAGSADSNTGQPSLGGSRRRRSSAHYRHPSHSPDATARAAEAFAGAAVPDSPGDDKDEASDAHPKLDEAKAQEGERVVSVQQDAVVATATKQEDDQDGEEDPHREASKHTDGMSITESASGSLLVHEDSKASRVLHSPGLATSSASSSIDDDTADSDSAGAGDVSGLDARPPLFISGDCVAGGVIRLLERGVGPDDAPFVVPAEAVAWDVASHHGAAPPRLPPPLPDGSLLLTHALVGARLRATVTVTQHHRPEALESLSAVSSVVAPFTAASSAATTAADVTCTALRIVSDDDGVKLCVETVELGLIDWDTDLGAWCSASNTSTRAVPSSSSMGHQGQGPSDRSPLRLSLDIVWSVDGVAIPAAASCGALPADAVPLMDGCVSAVVTAAILGRAADRSASSHGRSGSRLSRASIDSNGPQQQRQGGHHHGPRFHGCAALVSPGEDGCDVAMLWPPPVVARPAVVRRGSVAAVTTLCIDTDLAAHMRAQSPWRAAVVPRSMLPSIAAPSPGVAHSHSSLHGLAELAAYVATDDDAAQPPALLGALLEAYTSHAPTADDAVAVVCGWLPRDRRWAGDGGAPALFIDGGKDNAAALGVPVVIPVSTCRWSLPLLPRRLAAAVDDIARHLHSLGRGAYAAHVAFPQLGLATDGPHPIDDATNAANENGSPAEGQAGEKEHSSTPQVRTKPRHNSLRIVDDSDSDDDGDKPRLERAATGLPPPVPTSRRQSLVNTPPSAAPAVPQRRGSVNASTASAGANGSGVVGGPAKVTAAPLEGALVVSLTGVVASAIRGRTETGPVLFRSRWETCGGRAALMCLQDGTVVGLNHADGLAMPMVPITALSADGADSSMVDETRSSSVEDNQKQKTPTSSMAFRTPAKDAPWAALRLAIAERYYHGRHCKAAAPSAVVDRSFPFTLPAAVAATAAITTPEDGGHGAARGAATVALIRYVVCDAL